MSKRRRIQREKPNESPEEHKQRRPRVENFCCDLCGSKTILKQGERRRKRTKQRKPPTPRYKIDPETGKKLCLCNACGLSFGRRLIRNPATVVSSPSEKKKLVKRAEEFGQSLVRLLNDDDATLLYCSKVTSSPCGCIQKYLTGEDGSVDKTKAVGLLNVYQSALQLSRQPGRRRPPAYDQFVQEERKRLRDDYHFCEIAAKKILRYSNNFLYKALKTGEGKSRAEFTNGKSRRHVLNSFGDLSEIECCPIKCTQSILKIEDKAKDWRKRYGEQKQIENREIISEMLSSHFCDNFIQLITGCTDFAIRVVKERLKKGIPLDYRNVKRKRFIKEEEEEDIESEEEEENKVTSQQRKPITRSRSSIDSALTDFFVEVLPSKRKCLTTPKDDDDASPYLGPGAMHVFAAEAAAACGNF